MQKELAAKKPTISIEKTTAIVCPCGNSSFSEAVKLRKASKFLTGTAEDGIMPIPVFVCTKCGEVNQDTLYPALRNNPGNVSE